MLCFILISLQSAVRDQKWRNDTQSELPKWGASFEEILAEIPREELKEIPPGSDFRSASEDPSSEYQPPLSSSEPKEKGRRSIVTRSMARAGYRPTEESNHLGDIDSTDNGHEPAIPGKGRKRGFSQVSSSPKNQPALKRSTGASIRSRGKGRQHVNRFCTQRCLLGLQRGGCIG